jgi:spermidine synthase
MEWFAEVSESDARTSYQLTPVWRGSTKFQEVMIGDSPVYGRMLFLDGELQSASADEHIYHETLVHPVMALGPEKARVLVVGGGEGATVREVLRWSPSVVDWVDIDGELVDLCREHLGWAADDVYEGSNVVYYPEDIEKVLPRLGSYDVIILDLPDPDGDTGYLYSVFFWLDLMKHLSTDGIIVSHCGPVRPYGGVGAGYQRIHKAIGSVGWNLFYHVGIPSFQGEWGFYMFRRSVHGPLHERALPSGLRVVDHDQLNAWARSSKMWREAVNQSSLITVLSNS